MHDDPQRAAGPGGPSRRQILAGLAGTLATAACTREDARAAAGPARPVRPLSAFGIAPSSPTDQWQKLTRAFADAHADGLSLVADPHAQYRHDGPLTLDGVSFEGQGCSFTALSDGPQVLRCLGDGWRIANLSMLGAATVRNNSNLFNGIWVGDEGPHSAADFVLENVSVGAVAPGRGVATAGIMFSNAHRGRILGPSVRNSLADGIHITGGSSDLAFERALVEDSGDDGFAVVSYRAQKWICSAIHLAGGISRRSAARGFSVVGGHDVTYRNVRVEASSAAGIYLYGEGGFDTFGVANCTVTDAVVKDCVTGLHLPPGFSNAAIIVGGRDGSDRIDGLTLPRGSADCVIRNAVVEGGGAACTAAISLHQYAIRSHVVGARIRGTGRRLGGLATNGIEIRGQDARIENAQMTDVPGIAILVGTTASGACSVVAPHVDGSSLRGGPIDSFIYAEGAPALRRLEVRDGVFARGPRRLSTSLLPDERITLAGNRLS